MLKTILKMRELIIILLIVSPFTSYSKEKAHITDQYKANYTFKATDGIPLKEAFIGAIKKNAYVVWDGMELGFRKGAKSTLRIILDDIEPGSYFIGVYCRTSHRGKKYSSIRFYEIKVNGEKITMRNDVPDLLQKRKFAVGTLLSKNPIELQNQSTLDISIATNAHAVGRIMLFKNKKNIDSIPLIYQKYKRALPKKQAKSNNNLMLKRKVSSNFSNNSKHGMIIKQISAPRGIHQVRELNKNWQYIPIKNHKELSIPPPTYGWKPINIPSNVKTPGAFYRLFLTIPENTNLTDRGLVLSFDQIWSVSKIFLDGKLIGETHAESQLTNINITNLVTPGKKHELLLAVRQAKGYPDKFVLGAIYRRKRIPYNGIRIAPKLIICGRAFLDWVFVRTSVREKKIRIDTHVINTSQNKISLSARHKIYDENNNCVFEFESLPKEIGPREKVALISEKEWKGVKLWWLHKPYIYTLKTELVSNEKIEDVYDPINFGFREFYLDGVNYILNGKRLFLDTSGHAGNFNHNPETNCHRIHTTWVDILMKLCGSNPEIPQKLLIPQFLQGTRRPYNHPEFFKYYKAYVQGWVKRLCNNPAVVMYSIENEVLHCGKQAEHPTLPEKLADIGKAVKEIDPTRPWMYNGDGDLNGNPSVPIINIHYPRNLCLGRLLPDDIHWLDGTGTFRIDSNIGKVTWDRKKPIFLGEAWWLDTVGAPWALSTHFGEEVYEGFFYNLPFWAKAVNYYINHFRLSGVMAVDPFHVPLLKHKSVDIIDETFRYSYEPGIVDRSFYLVNETQINGKVIVNWTLKKSTNNTLIDQGTIECFIPGGEYRTSNIKMIFPKTNNLQEYILETEVFFPSKEIVIKPHKRKWNFINAGNLKAPLSKYFVTVKGTGRLTETLKGMGATVKPFVDFTSLADDTVLLIEGNSDTSLSPQELSHFVEKGGRLLYLFSQSKPIWTPLQLLWSNQEANFSFIRSPNHPIFKGLPKNAFSLWNPGYRVAKSIPYKPSSGAFNILLENGSASGLKFTPLLEMPFGKGTCIVSRLSILDKIKTEPIASHILVSLLKYLTVLKFKTPSRLATILPLDEYRFLTQKSGIVGDNIVGTDVTLENYDVLLINSSEYSGNVAPIIKFVKKGGTLILRSLTEESMKQFSDIFPKNLSIRKAAYPQTVRIDTPELLDGISQEDLLWMWGIMRENAPMKSNAKIVTYEILLDKSCGSWKLLTKNFLNDGKFHGHDKINGEKWSNGGALAIGQYGKGFVIIDQINWTDGYIYCPEKLSRIVSSMYSNLNVKVSNSVFERKWSYSPVKIPANRSLTEWMGWKKNNMSRFPTGSINLHGIPFSIPNTELQCIMLRSENMMKKLPKKSKPITINAIADQLCFLQTCTYGFDFEVNKLVMRYNIEYDDNTSAHINVRYADGIFDWQRPPGLLSRETEVAWDGGTPEHDHAYVFLMRVTNPYPGKKIKYLTMSSGKSRAVPILMGLTLANEIKNKKIKNNKKIIPKQDKSNWRIKERKQLLKSNKMFTWHVIGPFDNPVTATDINGTGLFIKYFSEKTVNLQGKYPGKRGIVCWKEIKVLEGLETPKKYHSHIDFNDIFQTAGSQSIAYAYTDFYVKNKQNAIFNFGSDDGAKVWLNGKQIMSVHLSRGTGGPTQEKIDVKLKKGLNTFLIKVEQMGGGWEFYMRLDDKKGKPLNITKRKTLIL